MSDNVTVITDLPSKAQKRRRAAGRVTFYGIMLVGGILLVDDAVKTLKKKTAKTDSND